MMSISKSAYNKALQLLALNRGIKKGGKGWDLVLYTALLLTTPETCPMLRTHYQQMVDAEQRNNPTLTLTINY